MSGSPEKAYWEAVVRITQRAEREAESFPAGSPEREAVYRKANEDLLQAMRDIEAGSRVWDFSKERAQAVFARDNTVVLRPMAAADAGFYESVRRQYSGSLHSLAEGREQVAESLFSLEVCREQSFFCVIEKADDRTPVGYLGVKDTRQEIWEIVIELDGEYVNRGLGPRSIRLFLNELGRITGKTAYHALVEPDNIRSQKCFEKLGGKLGVSQYVFAMDPESLARYEEEHQDRVDDHMVKLANRLGAEPRKLLTHVLDYTITL